MKLLTNQLFIGLIAGLALGYFFFHNCNHPSPCPDVVTSIKSDTGHVHSTDQTDWYKPDTEFSFAEGGKIPSDVFGTTEFYKPKPSVKKDTSAKTGFTSDFDFTKTDADSDTQSQTTQLPTNFYKDRVKTQYGYITIEDTLRNNEIAARRVTTDFTIPVVTNKIILNEKPKPKLYWAVTAIGDQNNYLTAAGGGLMFQFKNKKAISVNALYQFKKLFPGQSNTQYQLTLSTPFSRK